jgi:hypothetical protein
MPPRVTAVAVAREKVCDSSRGQRPRRAAVSRARHLHPHNLHVRGSSHVGPPNPALRRTRRRDLPGSGFSLVVLVLHARGAAPPNARLGGLRSAFTKFPRAVLPRIDILARIPRAVRARRLAPSARAPRSAASVRFTPARPASLSPRRAPRLPALPPPSPQRRPARCGAGSPPALPRLDRRTSLRRHRSITPSAESSTASRPPPPGRLDSAADRRDWPVCSDADGATCSASGAGSLRRPSGIAQGLAPWPAASRCVPAAMRRLGCTPAARGESLFPFVARVLAPRAAGALCCAVAISS